MKAIDDRADRTTFLCGGGKNFPPIGTAHFAAAGKIDFAGLKLVERFGEQAKWFFLFSKNVNHHHRHRATGEFHFLSQRLDGLREKLMREAKVVEDVAHNRRVKLAGAQRK